MLAGLAFYLLIAQGSSASLLDRAASLAARGELKPAIALLEEAAAADEVSRHPEQLARDRVALGNCLSAIGRTDDAVAQLTQALLIWRGLDAPEATVLTLQQLGVVLFAHSRLDEARLRLEEAREIARIHGLSEATLESNLGMVLHAMGKPDEAMEHYEKALAVLECAGDTMAAANTRGNIANLHLTKGDFAKAESAYTLARAAFAAAGDAARATTTTVNLGMVQLAQGKYDEARATLEAGHARARLEGWGELEASALLHLASVFEATGLFDKAETAYTESLRLFQAADNPQNAAAALRGLGSLQLTWGHADRALSIASEGLALAERHGIQDQVLASLQIIGSAHLAGGRFNTAILHYRRGLALARRLGRDSEISRFEVALGAAFVGWGKPLEAEKHFDEALSVASRLGQRHLVSQAQIYLGAIRQLRGDLEGARVAYERGLTISRSSGTMADEAVALGNLGTLALASGERREAERRLLETIALREKIRLTTKGEDRAPTLEAWISSYRWLIHLYFLEGNASAAFEASERIRARHLAEQMSEHSLEGSGGDFDLEAFRQGLGSSEAVVSFANVDWRHPVAIVITREDSKIYALDVPALRNRLGIGDAPDDPAALLRPDLMGRKDDLGGLVAEYRRLLALAQPSPAERRRRDRFARGLHETLLGPAEALLGNAKDLVIIPEGCLSLVPFETLHLSDGHFLVTRHNIAYEPSGRVMQILRQRRRQQRARSLLAFGGAPHGAAGRSVASAVSTPQMEALRTSARRYTEKGKVAGEVYAALGFGRWADLPEAREEVEALGRIVPESTVLTGDDVSEKGLKALSRAGVLREYRTLHFATHGITVAEAPELSALVFSEAGGKGDSEEDGYLSLREIAALDIQPDLVTLSSCESGLGRIYGGEGTVGLAQAFLGAGANGVAVSLWQVHDAHAREFMIRLYEAFQVQGMTQAQAMSEAKRHFIREGKANPALWATFVYYGN